MICLKQVSEESISFEKKNYMKKNVHCLNKIAFSFKKIVFSLNTKSKLALWPRNAISDQVALS